MEEQRRLPRERELVLAPNEYAWVLDTTKGHINCYVGPNKTSLAQTDQPVIFDDEARRFVHAMELSTAIQLFATAPENWYLVLKNPAQDGGHPRVGVASGLAELHVGKKVVVRGPTSFALWPGQMARVVEGHRLASSQYVVVQVYDAALANKDAALALAVDVVADDFTFEVGQRFVVQGDRAGFYMPVNGVEVVADEHGRFVRDAVTLQRLEYCVLAKENGKKRMVRGEAVVFPAPDERFVEVNGRRAFRALELSPTTGVHIKVIAPYVDDDGVAHAEGDELFVTGTQTRLYFPREEHAMVRPGNGAEQHHAVAIPAGEGRYVLDKTSGDVRLVVGPRMLLADPRHEVMVRRALSDRESVLLYPGNDEALQHNRALRNGTVPKTVVAPASGVQPTTTKATSHDGVDTFSRSFTKPATLLLDSKYDGAVSVDVWSGYAVCVKDRRGQRRVVQGPHTVLLAFDETLEALTLSTGKPKTTQRLLPTVYLKVQGNQVSDIIEVVSADLVEARVHVTFRVSFDGDADRWFVVDNYVKLLCEHAGSIVKGRARKTPIRQLRAEVVDLVRDAVLGERTDGERKGLRFAENGLCVFDVEVHECEIVDERVRDLLDASQLETVRAAVTVASTTASLSDKQRLEEVARQLLQQDQQTKLLALQLETELEEGTWELERRRVQHKRAVQAMQAEQELSAVQADGALRALRLATKAKEAAVEIDELEQRQRLEVAFLLAHTDARVRQAQAVSPELSASLQRLGDAQLLSSLSENFGELAAVEGRGLLETAKKFLDFAPSPAFPLLKRADAE
jgi:major vault protein